MRWNWISRYDYIDGQSHDIEGNVKMKVSSSNLTPVYIGPLAQKK